MSRSPSRGRHAGDHPPRPAPARLSGAPERRQQALGQPASGPAQRGIGGHRQIGQQSDGGVSVAGQLDGECRLVELSDLR